MGKRKKYIKAWLISGVVLITLMVVIGGITRLTNSGLSIVEWNVISGTIPPLSDVQWNITFEKYKQFPEYRKLNYGMNLAQFKQIFWWEYIHRLLGRVIGIVFLIPFLIFYIKKWLSKPLLKWLLVIFFLGALQGAMGWFMVMSGLVDQPHVSHFRLAAHLSLALILIGVITWTILKLNDKDFSASSQVKRSMIIPYTCLILLFLQIILGAFVAGLDAGFTFNNFPMMGQTIFPSETVMSINAPLYNGVFHQFIHRWFAFIVLAAFIALYQKSKPVPVIRRYTASLLLIILLQIVVGIITLLLYVPVSLGVLHQFIAVVLFIITVIVTYQFKYNEESELTAVYMAKV